MQHSSLSSNLDAKTQQQLFNKLLLFYAVLIVFLTWGTGLASDDFTIMGNNTSFLEPAGNLINVPFFHLTHVNVLTNFGEDSAWLIDFFKSAYLILCLYLCVKFFNCFTSIRQAFLFSFLFLFYPSHDGSTYWFFGQYLCLSAAFLFYAYYLLAKKQAHGYAVAMAFLGSFMCYGSPAVVFALCVLCLLKKEKIWALCLFIPNLIYGFFYIYSTKVAQVYESRIHPPSSVSALAKKAVLQAGTFCDANFGPSFLLKIFHSIASVTIVSLLIMGIGLFIYKKSLFKEGDLSTKVGRDFTIFIFILCAANLAMFTVTGKYPQLAFNLGNKVSTFTCLLFIPLLTWGKLAIHYRQMLLAILLLSIVGLSSHWKAWSSQRKSIELSMNNLDKKLLANKSIFVSGHQYSALGPLGHIEHFSEHWVVDSVAKLHIDPSVNAYSLSAKRFKVEETGLFDLKYQELIPLEQKNYVYDSENNRLLHLDIDELQHYINGLKKNKRHWIQLYSDHPLIQYLKTFNPRLEYAL